MRSDMSTVRENSRQRGPVRQTDLRQVAIECQSDFTRRAIDAGYQPVACGLLYRVEREHPPEGTGLVESKRVICKDDFVQLSANYDYA